MRVIGFWWILLMFFSIDATGQETRWRIVEDGSELFFYEHKSELSNFGSRRIVTKEYRIPKHVVINNTLVGDLLSIQINISNIYLKRENMPSGGLIEISHPQILGFAQTTTPQLSGCSNITVSNVDSLKKWIDESLQTSAFANNTDIDLMTEFPAQVKKSNCGGNGGATVTANTYSNGLTKTGDDVHLGGTLEENTNIASAGNDFTFVGTGGGIVALANTLSSGRTNTFGLDGTTFGNDLIGVRTIHSGITNQLLIGDWSGLGGSQNQTAIGIYDQTFSHISSILGDLGDNGDNPRIDMAAIDHGTNIKAQLNLDTNHVLMVFNNGTFQNQATGSLELAPSRAVFAYYFNEASVGNYNRGLLSFTDEHTLLGYGIETGTATVSGEETKFELSDNAKFNTSVQNEIEEVTEGGTFVVTIKHSVLNFDNSAGAQVIELPILPLEKKGTTYHLKWVAGANMLMIDPEGATTIDGAATFLFTTSMQSKIVRWDGDEYFFYD